jgi:hypothetical protein
MIAEMLVGNKLGSASHLAMNLDYMLNQWKITEGRVSWLGWGFSAEGTFEVRSNGVIWIWEQKPGKEKRNTLIMRDAPMSEADVGHISGIMRIYDPPNATQKDIEFLWRIRDVRALTQLVSGGIHNFQDATKLLELGKVAASPALVADGINKTQNWIGAVIESDDTYDRYQRLAWMIPYETKDWHRSPMKGRFITANGDLSALRSRLRMGQSPDPFDWTRAEISLRRIAVYARALTSDDLAEADYKLLFEEEHRPDDGLYRVFGCVALTVAIGIGAAVVLPLLVEVGTAAAVVVDEATLAGVVRVLGFRVINWLVQNPMAVEAAIELTAGTIIAVATEDASAVLSNISPETIIYIFITIKFKLGGNRRAWVRAEVCPPTADGKKRLRIVETSPEFEELPKPNRPSQPAPTAPAPPSKPPEPNARLYAPSPRRVLDASTGSFNPPPEDLKIKCGPSIRAAKAKYGDSNCDEHQWHNMANLPSDLKPSRQPSDLGGEHCVVFVTHNGRLYIIDSSVKQYVREPGRNPPGGKIDIKAIMDFDTQNPNIKLTDAVNSGIFSYEQYETLKRLCRGR